MATLVEAMAVNLRSRGVDIRLGTAAEHLGREGGEMDRRHRRRRRSKPAPSCWPRPRPSPRHCSSSTTARRRPCSKGSTTPRSSSSPSASASTTFLRRKEPVSSCPGADRRRARTRRVGRDGLHLSRPQVASPRARRRSPAPGLTRSGGRHPGRVVGRRGGAGAGVGGARPAARGRERAGGHRRDALSPTPSRNTACTTSSAPPASRPRRAAWAGWPSPGPPTAGSGSRPVSPAGGRRHVP